MNFRFASLLRLSMILVLFLGTFLQPQYTVLALTTLTVEPLTWNVVGLDSNNVNVGPNDFPVGARVCNTGSEAATNVTAVYNWDSADAYIALRGGTLSTINLGTLNAGACADAYFEVEVTRNSSAYNHTRRYHIDVTAGNVTGTISTPTPREVFVEHLVSQNRNAVTDVQLNGVSVAPGGTMTLMVGQTYTIELIGYTATQGYEQIEYFINFPNTIFQILSVSSTFDADTSATVGPSPIDKLYGDNCVWENDPNSPNYRACLSTGKTGGNITTTYQVKILQVPGAPLVNPEPLSTLIYDFSGSSFHYNSDYGISTRYAYIVNASIAKAFSPKTINPGGTSTLTFAINNPGPAAITGVNFTDTLPSGVTISSSTITYNGCGSPSPASLTVGDTALSFSNITVAGLGICTVAVSVTASTDGTYNNTSGHLFINNSVDTGSFATDTLVVSSTPAAPSSCATPVTLASWSFPATGQGSGGGATTPDYTTKAADVASATALYTAGAAGTPAISTAQGSPAVNSWSGTNGWAPDNTGFPSATTGPYFTFTVDTSNYGGVRVSFNYALLANGDWANPGNNFVYTYSSANGGAYSTLSSIVASKGNWFASGTINAAATGTSTTAFRINTVGANKTTSAAHIDEIIISGCARPVLPTLSKAFSPTTIAQGNASALTFTFTNPNTTALSAISFSDTLPTGLVINTPNGLSAISCTTGSVVTAPTITATQATSLISMSGLQLAANSSCSFSVSVKGNVAGAYTNTSGNITSTSTGPNTTSTGYGVSSLTVVAPPVIAKSFTANPILTGASTTLSFTINNPNTATALTGVNFTDNLPAGLVIAATPNLTNTCGGTATATAGSSIVSLSGVSLAAGTACTITVSVTGNTVGLKNNSVTVGSTNGGTGNTSTASVLVKDPAPAITLLKQVGPTAAGPWTSFLSIGTSAAVYYRFTVENTGDVDLASVNVTDPPGGAAVSCSWTDGDGNPLTAPFTLTKPASGNNAHIATCTLSTTSNATVGSYPNTARASGTSGTTVTDDSTATYANPQLSIVKSANPGYYNAVGNTITYSYLVTNNGFVPLLGPVSVADDKSTNESCPAVSTVGDGDNWFDVGESITCTSSYDIVAGDVTAGSVTNIASASAGSITSPTDSETVYLAALTIDKDTTTPNIDNNNDVIYTVVVVNTGQIALTNFQASDVLPVFGGTSAVLSVTAPGYTVNGSYTGIAPNTNLLAGTDTLAVGATVTITITVDLVNATAGVYDNTAVVTTTQTGSVDDNGFVGGDAGTPGIGADPETDEDVTVTSSTPAINVAKSSTTTSITAAGQVVPYTFTVTNVGNVTLTGVTVSDPNCAVAPAYQSGDTNTNNSLELTETWIYTCSHTVMQAEVDAGGNLSNTVTADSTESGPDTDTLNIPVTQTPAINVVKSSTTTSITAVGQVVPYTFTVTNVGNTTLTGITVSDPNCAVAPAYQSGDTNTNNSLELTETWIYTCSHTVTQAEVDTGGNLSNTVTADSTESGPDTDTLNIPVTQTPAINVVKSSTTTSITAAGQVVPYTFTVTNAGNVTLTGVTVSDPNCAVAPAYQSGDTNTNNSLELTETWIYACSHTVTQAEVNAGGNLSNTVTADSTESGPDTDILNIPVAQTPALTLNKIYNGYTDNDSSTTLTVGDDLNFTITMTNTGNITLTTVSVTDPQLTPNVQNCASVALGGTCVLNGTYTLTQADVDTGSFTNTATVTDDDVCPAAGAGVCTDGVTTPIPQNPALTLNKIYNGYTDNDASTTLTVGDDLNFTITMTNTGNTTLTVVSVTDPQLTPNNQTCATVAPGATCVLNGSYTVTQGDVDAGSFTNTATVTDNDLCPAAGAGTCSSTVNTPIPQNPGLTLNKVYNGYTDNDASTTLTLGDDLNFTITMTNTGNTTLTNISVSDPQLTPNNQTCASVAPGGTCVLNGIYTVQQNDVNAGAFQNTATVTDDNVCPAAGAGTCSSTVNTPIPQTPALTLNKVYNGYTDNDASTTLTLGDDLNFTITMTNTGNITLTTVSVTDPQLTPNTQNCASVAPGATCVLNGSYTVTQTDVDTGTFQNTAAVTDDDVCPAAGTGTCNSTVNTPIPQTPAVNIVKSPAAQTVLTGGTANFTLTVTNTGTVTLTGVVVTDVQCTTGPTYIGGDTNGDNQLQLAETWLYSCSVTNVTANFTNTADVSTNEGSTDNATANVIVTAMQSDLELDKSVSNTTPLVTTNIDFTITITNVGPDTADNIEVTDILPSGFTYVTDSATQGNYNEVTGIWNVGTLALNQTETLTITVTVNITGSYTNDAEITASSEVDPDSTPNNGSSNEDDDDSVTVTPTQNNPVLSKSLTGSNQAFTSNPEVAIGEIVEYTVTIEVPPGVFANSEMVDTMERGLSFMTCTSITPGNPALTTDVAGSFASACAAPTVDDAGGGTTVDIGRRVTFDLGTLTNASGTDQNLTFVYTTVVLDNAGNVSGVNLTNDAEWRSNGVSTPLGSANVSVAEPEVSIVKTANTTLVSVGSEITITLRIQHTSDSETNAYDTLVTDQLPAELDYVPGTLECASGAQDADVLCNYDTGTRTISAIWSNFSLGGGDGQVTFRVRINSLPSNGIRNVGNVAWTSLPGSVNTPQNSNPFSTERDYDPPSSIDIYGTSSTLVLGVFNSTPATGFAPNKVTKLGHPSVVYAQTGVNVEIRSLGINIPIVGVPLKNGGWDVSWLGKQAGWLEGSAFPSWNGNSVVTGHVYDSNGLPGPFVNLNGLKYGDKIIVDAYGQRYTFEVRANTVVEPNDASIFKHEDKSWLTLVTCKEFDEKTNTYRKRVVVRAVLVSVSWR